MKILTKLSLIAAAAAALGTGAAFADDHTLQNRLLMQRGQDLQGSPRPTTVAVYANERGIGSRAVQDERSEARFEMHFNAHGQTYGAYVFAK